MISMASMTSMTSLTLQLLLTDFVNLETSKIREHKPSKLISTKLNSTENNQLSALAML